MTPADCATLKARLAEAQDAYHKLTTGTMARVLVDQNGERVEFNPASAPRLMVYISSLQTQIAQNCGCEGSANAVVGPMRFLF